MYAEEVGEYVDQRLDPRQSVVAADELHVLDRVFRQ